MRLRKKPREEMGRKSFRRSKAFFLKKKIEKINDIFTSIEKTMSLDKENTYTCHLGSK